MWANGMEARIEDLFVSPNGRQKGNGKALVDFAIKMAEEKNCASICLDTNENNKASTRIYTQLGFNSKSKNWNNGKQIFFRRSLNIQ
jgi:ribosomal protein S18 acetylase RimI-like enzyme